MVIQDESTSSTVISKGEKRKLYKRTLWIVSISQMFGGAGLAAGITVGALLARQMLGTDALAGLPTALFTLGSAFAAFMVGRLTQKFGRRIGLFTGFMLGGVGSLGVIVAAVLHNPILLFLSLFIYGSGTATNLQARYAGTDLAENKQRATAVSIAMVSTTFGAVAGPNLVNVMGEVAISLGIPPLAGPFILAGAAFFIAGIVLYFFLRPDPFILAKRMEQELKGDIPETDLHISENKMNKKGIILGASIMIVTQIIMVAIMTMTPIHMEHHGHAVGAIGLVIGIHVGAMYLPSLFTGYIIDKTGRYFMAFIAIVILILAGVIGAFGSGDSMTVLIVSLALLGLGWNLGLISGTTIIVDHTTIKTRAKTQGAIDVFIALAGASGGALSGMVVSSTSFTALSLFGGLLSLILVPIMIWVRKG